MIVSLLLAGLLGLAFADKPTCEDFKSQICNFLDAHHGEKYIRLADGSRTYNTFFEPGSRSPADEPTETGSIPGQKKLNNQKLMAATLKLLDVKGLSPDSQNTLADHALEIFDPIPGTMTVPVPFTAGRAKAVNRPRDEVAHDVASLLGEKKFNALRDLVKQHEPQFKMLGENARQGREKGTNMNKEMAEFASDVKLMGAKEARVQQMFDDAKAFEISLIAAGKPRSAWTDEQKSMIARIEPMKMRIMSEAETSKQKGCDIDGLPNAFNTINTKTVELCRQMLLQPDGALAFQLAHEIGHVNDACAVQNDLAKVDPDQLTQFKGAKFYKKDEWEALSNLESTEYLTSDHFESLESTNLYAGLVKSGAVRVLGKRFDTYPEFYKKIYGCIAQKYALRVPDAAAREKRIAEKQATLARYSGKTKPEQEAELRRYRHYLESRKDCAAGDNDTPVTKEGPPPPQMMEAMADMWGTLYQEHFFQKNPPRTEGERALALFLAGRSCTEMPNHISAGNHPEDAKRISMQLDSPGIASVMGCTRAEAGCFDHLSQSAGGTRDSSGKTEASQ